MKVKPELFLHQVGSVVCSEDGCHVWEVKELGRNSFFKHLDLPPLIYVVDFPGRGAGQQFLLGREICGPRKFLMIREVGHRMIRLFTRQFVGRVAQFVILWGGRPLDMLDADPPIYPGTLVDTTYIKLTRIENASAARGWMVENSALVGQWWQDDTWVVMEECIASGNTLRFFLEEALKHHQPKKIFIFPVCASAEGLHGLYSLCAKHGVDFVPVLNEAIIQVAEQGIVKPFTDLGLQPHTILPEEYYRKLATRYQDLPICFVGDIGDSLYKPEEHVMETLHDMAAVGMDLHREDFSKWHPYIYSEECRVLLSKQGVVLHPPR